MKKTILMLVCGLLAGYWALAGTNAGKTFGDLPEISQMFLQKYFPDDRIMRIKVDRHNTHPYKYKVEMDRGVYVEFDGGGDWSKIVSNRYPLPAGVVPKPIIAYIRHHYANHSVRILEQNVKNYTVVLTGGLDLVFDLNGRFIRKAN